jgi:hypothetical protein
MPRSSEIVRPEIGANVVDCGVDFRCAGEQGMRIRARFRPGIEVDVALADVVKRHT